MLRALNETCKLQWKDELEYTYNCTKHSVTGYNPYYLLFCGKLRLPVHFILKEQQEIEVQEKDYNNY